VAQAAVPVRDGDDEETLRLRILKREHELLPRVLQWIAEGRMVVEPVGPAPLRPRVRLRGVDGSASVDPD
jgi:phosphoribosylglycinamide formyltransferase-1